MLMMTGINLHNGVGANTDRDVDRRIIISPDGRGLHRLITIGFAAWNPELHIAKKYQDAGLPKGKSININLAGSAGQSFGAFLISGVIMTLEGDANDYLGKGLSGGTLVVFPPKDSSFASEENVIAGKSIKVVASMKMQGFPFPVKMIGG